MIATPGRLLVDMEDTNKQCPETAQDPGIETTRYLAIGSRCQVDFLHEVTDPGELSLDSLLYGKSEVSCAKREGPGSSDNSELDNVLDCILDSPTSDQRLWSECGIPEIHGIADIKTPCDSKGGMVDIGVWTEASGSGKKGTLDRAIMEDFTENQSTVKSGVSGIAQSRHLHLAPERNLITLPNLDMNVLYLSAQERELVKGGGHDQRSSPLNPSQKPSSYTSQISIVHPEDGQVKQEGSGVLLYHSKKERQDFKLPTSGPATPEPEESMDFILCKTESATIYQPCTHNMGKPSENQIHVAPSSSSSSQTIYQTLSLNGQQQHSYQAGGVSRTYLPQIPLSYVQYIRSEDPDETPQYGFDSSPLKICLICADEASGCHYGVLTCGSCKVFFKRAIEGQHNYLCAGRNDCIVDKIRRKNCPSCRLRKCCQAGMILGGRKFKKFNRMKPGREMETVVLQQARPLESQQALTRRLSISPTQEIQYIPELLHILQSIEPEMVYAGYDNTQPETPSALLCSLNQLCERQLLCVVKWSKSLPGFRNLHIDDQITLLQYSWMSLMVFAMGWRSYQHVSGQMLYFAPDLILNEQRMKDSSFYALCLSMRQLPQEFVKLQITHEEFLCMKALLLLNTIPLEGLKSQSLFDEMRSNYIRELAKAISLRHKGVVASSQRFYHLTKVMDSMHELVKQLHLYCLNTFLQSRALSVEFPEMMTEVISAQLPKILAGMVKPLVFHKK
ncbi:progesterone receptor isoform X1 [Bufo bufo]|uniref:progesterone receptor isoform X1 n=1 Tax=Bufo bufo TaxID=8384 RepID=UPI001ABE099E|nr:progesterone receptor isoform X1 [Bufo bufo]